MKLNNLLTESISVTVEPHMVDQDERWIVKANGKQVGDWHYSKQQAEQHADRVKKGIKT